MRESRAHGCQRHWGSAVGPICYLSGILSPRSGHNCPGLFRFRVGDVQVHYGGRCNRFAYAPTSPGIRVPRGPARWYSPPSPLHRPLSTHAPIPFPSDYPANDRRSQHISRYARYDIAILC